MGGELTLRAWLEDVNGRKISTRGEGYSPEGRFLDADRLLVA